MLILMLIYVSELCPCAVKDFPEFSLCFENIFSLMMYWITQIEDLQWFDVEYGIYFASETGLLVFSLVHLFSHCENNARDIFTKITTVNTCFTQ